MSCSAELSMKILNNLWTRYDGITCAKDPFLLVRTQIRKHLFLSRATCIHFMLHFMRCQFFMSYIHCNIIPYFYLAGLNMLLSVPVDHLDSFFNCLTVIIFLFLNDNICCDPSLEPSQ